MSNVELKPCPFCGSKLQKLILTPSASCISCICCGAHFNTHNKDEAIKAWNTRYERTVKLKDNGHCPDCNKLVGEGERFCAWCGAKVIE